MDLQPSAPLPRLEVAHGGLQIGVSQVILAPFQFCIAGEAICDIKSFVQPPPLAEHFPALSCAPNYLSACHRRRVIPRIALIFLASSCVE